ncbi:GPW/gp25 family protein [Citrobacter gillenii]|uniref:GPW/gp25 family protein n=2 Tax=Citrobacter TaxID=544 RepID=UPI0026900285
MRYLGMNQQDGTRLTELDHVRQSVRDILVTPVGSRLMRREYGSLIPDLIDEAQNPATRLRVMAATYGALCRWETRIRLTTINITSATDGSMVVDLTGTHVDGGPVNLSVGLGANQ